MSGFLGDSWRANVSNWAPHSIIGGRGTPSEAGRARGFIGRGHGTPSEVGDGAKGNMLHIGGCGSIVGDPDALRIERVRWSVRRGSAKFEVFHRGTGSVDLTAVYIAPAAALVKRTKRRVHRETRGETTARKYRCVDEPIFLQNCNGNAENHQW